MKKILKRFAAAAFTAIILILPVSLGVSAGRFDDADISLMNFNIDISSVGELSVSQSINFDFHSSVNGIYVDISDINSVKNLTVSVDGVLFSESSFSQNGDDGVYQLTDGRLKIFMPSESGDSRSVVLKYFVDGKAAGSVKKHADISDFYAELITGWDFDIENITAEVQTPLYNAEKRSDYLVWGHTNADGICRIEENGKFYFEAKKLLKGERFEIRALFPAESLEISPSGSVTKQDIINEENGYAAETERQKAEYRNKLAQQEKKYRIAGKAVGIMGIVFAVISAAVCIVLYSKYDREYPAEREYDYFRELPEPDASPAEVGCLWKFKKVDQTDITATILNLKYNKIIDIIPADIYTAQNGIKRKVKKDDFVIIPTGADLSALKAHERFVYDWFIGKIGLGKMLYLSDLRKHTKSDSAAREFISDYGSFKKAVKESAEQRNYFEKQRFGVKALCIVLGLFMIIAAVAAVFIVTLSGYAGGFSLLSLLGIPAGVLMIAYPVTIKRRTRYGNQKYTEWKAFRKFLLDFSNMKEAGEQSVAVWEYYLVYAVPLGVAETVIKQLKVNIPADAAQAQYGGYYPSLFDFMIWNNIMTNTINRSVAGAVTSATQQIARSQSGSSFGGGGGFSGGSFGGGGGGGFGGGGGSF